jgi:hypothetical protein
MKPKIYNYNHRGKMVHVKAYSKKDIGTYFGDSTKSLNDYCSITGWEPDNPSTKIDFDLTKQEKK